MSCFPCFFSNLRKASKQLDDEISQKINTSLPSQGNPNSSSEKTATKDEPFNKPVNGNIEARSFTFRELASATKNFRSECLLGEGGFGRVYKGKLDDTGQTVAVKQLDRNGLQGNSEFLVEVLMLSLLHHENLVNLIGYCADGEQRLLVYEFMPLGSLEDHLFDIGPDKIPLSWFARMKIAFGASRGLEYLHDTANPSVIYRDLKSSNILLDEEFNCKLSDFGLAKLGLKGDSVHVSSRVMGTYGYCAPEYVRAGELTLQSDVYSFGVVLLELISGRSAIDTTRPSNEQNLVAWALPIFKDRNRYTELADRRLNGDFPTKNLNQVIAIAAMCLQEEPSARPLISDVVTALSFLAEPPPDMNGNPSIPPSQDNNEAFSNENSKQKHEEVLKERQRVIAEAMEWGSNSRANNNMRCQYGNDSL